MTPARLALLALAALLATGGAFWLSSQRQLDRAVGVGDPVLPQLRAAINDVAEVRLSRGDGGRVTLRRDAGGWIVVERAWPADAGKVRKLLLDLSALAVVEEKTHDPARYPVLGVEDVDGPAATGTRIDVKTAKGAIQSLVLGKPSGGREGFVRAVGAAPSYLARPQVSAEGNPARWLDTSLLDIDATRVRAVTLTGPAAPALPLQDERLPTALAGALDGLALEDVRPRPLGAPGAVGGTSVEGPVRRARYTTWEGLVLEIAGREDGGRRWISVDASFDPSAARERPAPSSDPAATGPAPLPAAGTAAPGARPEGAAARTPAGDPRDEAKTIQRRTAGYEFEIPAYRYGALFEASSPAAGAAAAASLRDGAPPSR
ncbi:MAG: DUF4340 domain-containing protein [Steroidobacteraceae bacterium]|jgi:hypothetical protein|nr:DUF4340 domain-containing protein [Steroidobacteraceae bacterium]